MIVFLAFNFHALLVHKKTPEQELGSAFLSQEHLNPTDETDYIHFDKSIIPDFSDEKRKTATHEEQAGNKKRTLGKFCSLESYQNDMRKKSLNDRRETYFLISFMLQLISRNLRKDLVQTIKLYSSLVSQNQESKNLLLSYVKNGDLKVLEDRLRSSLNFLNSLPKSNYSNFYINIPNVELDAMKNTLPGDLESFICEKFYSMYSMVPDFRCSMK